MSAPPIAEATIRLTRQPVPDARGRGVDAWKAAHRHWARCARLLAGYDDPRARELREGVEERLADRGPEG
ncbi:hypothetical protein ABZ353_36735 [Streptomyces niveus]|uniref:hypothetical protein n=1 Tax=Streptomyces niveus TaxID=193462 RepID=UPI0033EB8CB2